jgi:S1-C subfamily serine protease
MAAALILMIAGAPFAFSQPQAEKTPAPVITSASDGPGALVVSVDPSSPAGTAGITRGDIVLSVNAKELAGSADLYSAVAQAKSGDKMELKIKHGDAERTVSVTLADRNGSPYLGIAPLAGGRSGRFGFRDFGNLAAASGALVVSVATGSPAEKAGLKAGDVIMAVDGTRLGAKDNDLATLISRHKVGDTVALSVRTGTAAARDVSVVLDRNPQKPEGPYLGVQYGNAAGMPGFRMMERMPEFNALPPSGPDGTTAPMPVSGALVDSVAEGSPAAAAGLKANDVITAIDGVSVVSAVAVADTVAKHKPGDTLVLTISRAENSKEMKEQKITVVLGQAPKAEGADQAEAKAYMGVTLTGRMMRRWLNSPDAPALPNRGLLRELAPRRGSDT